MELNGPDELWVADVTYVPIIGGFVYVAIGLDAWSRNVVGYALSRAIDARLAEVNRMPLVTSPNSAVPHLGAGHRDGAKPDLHLSLRTMPVPDDARPIIGALQIRPFGQEGLDVQCHSLDQELASTGPQHLRQEIIDIIRRTKTHRIAMLIPGVSLSPERFWQAWTPASMRRLS